LANDAAQTMIRCLVVRDARDEGLRNPNVDNVSPCLAGELFAAGWKPYTSGLSLMEKLYRPSPDTAGHLVHFGKLSRLSRVILLL
jgi:hypothetical protein